MNAISFDDVLVTQELPARHERDGAGVPGILEMGHVPVVGMFARLLRQVRPGPLGSHQGRLHAHVVACLGDPLGGPLPVVHAHIERVTVGAAVHDVEVEALLFQSVHGPPDRRGLHVHRRHGQEDHGEGRGPEDQECPDDQDGRRHLHAVLPSCDERMRIEGFTPVQRHEQVVKAHKGRRDDQDARCGARDHVGHDVRQDPVDHGSVVPGLALDQARDREHDERSRKARPGPGRTEGSRAEATRCVCVLYKE